MNNDTQRAGSGEEHLNKCKTLNNLKRELIFIIITQFFCEYVFNTGAINAADCILNCSGYTLLPHLVWDFFTKRIMNFPVKRQLMKILCVQSYISAACSPAYLFIVWKMWMGMFSISGSFSHWLVKLGMNHFFVAVFSYTFSTNKMH